MTTIKELALAFKPKEKLNVADLGIIDSSMDIVEIEGIDGEGKPYSYSAIIDGNKEYYVSKAVIWEMQKIFKLRPDAIKFQVRKSGSGKSTKYEVELLQ